MRAHRSLSSLLALLGLACISRAQFSDVPSLEDFYRRGAHSATVIGNYVYIDGGEVSQVLDGKIPKQQFRLSNPVNSTISIDISKPWTSSNVVLRTINRPWTSKSNQLIWTDHNAGVFYVWGGKWYGGKNMTGNELWKFTPDGSGGGSWALEPPANPELFDGLEQTEYAVTANSKDMGFAIGGVASGWTKKYRGRNQAIPGMVAFDMKSKVWDNGTAGFGPVLSGDTLAGGVGHYLPKFGPNGLIMLLGGVSHPVDVDPNWETARPYDLRNLTFFDPQTKETYWQETTGDIPPSPRSEFCLAGFQNADGGYEIMVMGGYNHRNKVLYKDAYILSLPGFVWTKAPDSPTGARRTPACVSVGNRQLLMVGGTGVGSWETKDTAPQGLALFDMTEMKWKDSYDPNAAVYERPAGIKTWYSNGSFDAVEWSSGKVRELFGVQAKSSGTAGPSTTNPSPSPDGTSTSVGASTPVGAIAGGVVGGLAAIAVIAVVVWLLIRRRREAAESKSGYENASSDGFHNENTEEAKTVSTGTETGLQGTNVERTELYTERYHSELGGSTAYGSPGLDQQNMSYEMDATPISQRAW